jgi:hypothetical protein
LSAEVYTDSYARGSHDWDTYLRLVDKGARPVHLPEVLYGWRMHVASSAMSSGAKDYLVDSQLETVRNSLMRRGLTNFEVGHAQGHEIGYCHLVRKAANLPAIRLRIVVRDDDDNPQVMARVSRLMSEIDYKPARIEVSLPRESPHRKAWSRTCPGTVLDYEDQTGLVSSLFDKPGVEEYTFIVDAALTPRHPDWLRDAVATFELDKTIGIVGGLILDEDGVVLHCGYIAGLDGFLDSPFDRGGFVTSSWNAIRRTITATYGGFVGIKTSVTGRVGYLRGIDGDTGLNGAEFCLRTLRAGISTAYCPTFSATRASALLPLAEASGNLRDYIAEEYADLIKSDPYYSALLSQKAKFYGTTAY